MENGHIAEQGTHQELMAQNGIYTDMYRRQQSLDGENNVENMPGTVVW